MLTNGDAVFACGQQAEFNKRWYEVAGALQDQATEIPVEAGLRIEVGIAPSTIGLVGVTHAYSWPLTKPIAGFATPPDQFFSIGVSRLVTDPEDVAGLAALREQFLKDIASDPAPQQQEIRIDRDYALYMRSELPFTKANGLLPFQ